MKILKEKKLTIATAESCTGGNIAHKITEVAGSSDYFKGSVVAYSNEIKQQVLSVPEAILTAHGAVSAQTVEAMAEGVRKLMHCEIAIATSGIAGPSGGTVDKPVGTVWIAVSTANGTTSRMDQFGTNRLQNIERTTQTVLLFLLEMIP